MEYLDAELLGTDEELCGELAGVVITTGDYEKLKNKPKVNGVELVGDKSSEELGIATKTSELTNDGDGESPFATEEYVEVNGGKIDKIYLNGSEQAIVDKEVRLVVDKATVGLGNVDNTSDADKPVSTAVQSALDGKVDKVAGKQLSDENYTASEKSKLGEIESGAQVNVLEGVQRNGVDLEIVGKKVNVSVPTKTSDISNDSGFIDKTVNNLDNYTTTSDLNTALGSKQDKTDNALDTTSKTVVGAINEVKGVADANALDITGLQGSKQDKTDNSLATASKTVVGAINEVNSVAKGATQAASFVDYSALITALNSASADTYNVGQSFYIQTKFVPDLWIISVENSSVPYTYTTDGAFILATEATGGQQVGYYKLAQLETQKVDLSGYVEKTTTIAGVDLQDDITKAEMQTALTDTTHNFVTDAEKTTWSGKQDALVSGTNIKTIDGESVLGAGDLPVKTYKTFPVGWTTDGTTAALMADIENDTSAVTGMAYLGEVTLTDMPFNGNAELRVEIMDGTGSAKTIVATLTSGNVSPYFWKYTYWVIGGTAQNSGWQGFLPNTPIDNTPTQNSDNLVKSGGVYSGLAGKQDTLISGTNIKTINNDSVLGSGNIDLSLAVLSGASDPTTSTTGEVNQFYRNTTTDKLFICTAVTAQGTNPETYVYTWKLASGEVDIIKIDTQYVRITDLSTGIYKLTYNGTKYIYYKGSTDTTVKNIGSEDKILIVNKGSSFGSYWVWEVLGSGGNGSITYGRTSSSDGSEYTFLFSNIQEALNSRRTYNTDTSFRIWGKSAGTYYLNSATSILYNGQNGTEDLLIRGKTLFHIFTNDTTRYWIAFAQTSANEIVLYTGSTSSTQGTYTSLSLSGLSNAISNSGKVSQAHNVQTTLYPLLARPVDITTTTTTTTNTIYNQDVYIQPSTGTIYANEFNLNGQDLSETIVISGVGNPTTNTVGAVNQLYRNTTNNKLFICTTITAQGTNPETYLYTWSEVGGVPIRRV